MDWGLTAGQTQEGVPSPPGADMLRGVFRRPRGMRDGGGVLIPTLIVRKKTAMRLFCGGKKGGDHDDSAMVWGRRERRDANDGGGFK